MMRRFLALIFLCLFSVNALALTLPLERKAFLAALSDLEHNQLKQFTVIAGQLRNYPLYPYLVYAELVQHLNDATPAQVDVFLKAYADTPLADHLRYLWFMQLAKNNQWSTLLLNYQPTTNLTVECLQRQALWATGQHDAAVANLATLFGTHESLPSPCLSVFEEALQSGVVAKDLVWQRLQIAMDANDMSLAKQLADLLPASDKPSFLLWQKLYIQAQRNPPQALTAWQALLKKYPLSYAEKQRVTRSIAIALAKVHDPRATILLNSITGVFADDTVLAWRIRNALWQQNWPQVLVSIHLLSSSAQQEPMWQYWLARALAAEGSTMAADTIYRNLATHDNFYGQLASLQLNQITPNYLLAPKVNLQQVQIIAQMPAMQRAYELYQLHWMDEARQEWDWALKQMPSQDYLAAASLAVQWGWYERAITTLRTLSGAGSVPLRFPLVYQQAILMDAHNVQINPAWVFAVIRQESSFMNDAQSGAGALGLMQLLPSTGLLIADQLHQHFSVHSLFSAGTNIRYGSVYLSKLAAIFHGNEVLATAGYNAGPARVEHWLPTTPVPADIWIENIPWQQTRHYVKNIMSSMTFYEQELRLPVTFRERLGVIQK